MGIRVDDDGNLICDRCHKKMTAFSMSRLNTDWLCEDCLEAEMKHPDYEEAKERERQEVLKGNYNYEGLLAGSKINI